MDPLWWIVWSGTCGLATGLLVYFIMRSHMDVLLSKQREELAGARAALAAQKESLTETLRNVEEGVRRKAMDEFLADIRVEERHYVREHKVLFGVFTRIECGALARFAYGGFFYEENRQHGVTWLSDRAKTGQFLSR